MRGKGGWNIGKKSQGNENKNLLYASITPSDYQPPEREATQRHDEINKRSMRIIGEHLHTRGNPNKLRNGNTCIGNKEGKHCKHCPAYAKLFADQIAEPFACCRTHTRAHFLSYRDENSGDSQGPQEIVPITGARGRIGCHTARVIARVRGDQAGSQHRQELDDRRGTVETKTRPRLLLMTCAVLR